MRQLNKYFKTAAVSAILAAGTMTATTASAIESGPDGTVIMYMSTWNSVQSLCSRVTCVSIVQQGSGWRVTWKA